MNKEMETPLTKDSALWFVIDVLENYVEDPRSENLIEKSIELCKEALELKPRELSDEELYYLHESYYGIDETGQWNLDYKAFARAILKKASEK